jgi:hypothetical protein
MEIHDHRAFVEFILEVYAIAALVLALVAWLVARHARRPRAWLLRAASLPVIVFTVVSVTTMTAGLGLLLAGAVAAPWLVGATVGGITSLRRSKRERIDAAASVDPGPGPRVREP